MPRYLEALIRQEDSRYAAECSRAGARVEADSPEAALVELEKLLAERLLPAGEDALTEDESLVLVVALYCGRIASAPDTEV